MQKIGRLECLTVLPSFKRIIIVPAIMMLSLFNPLRRITEGVLVVMMGIMFAAFIAQVVCRYVLNLPLAWSDEICNFLWLWGILWGASFVMRNHEDIRFDMLYNLLPRPVKRTLTIISSSLIVVLLTLSLPKTWSYISFMKVEKSAALGIPMNWVLVYTSCLF